MEPYRVLNPDGSLVGQKEPAMPMGLIETAFEKMLFARVLDDRLLGLQRQGRIGFYGTATGQEAAIIGSGLALRPEDWVFPALREGMVALLRGYPLSQFLAQVIGNSLDIQKGHQMPCHYSWKPANFVAWSSCIGTQLPQAVGAAMAAKIRKDPIGVIAYLGDGATSEGDFHAAMNFAGVNRSPVVFFCQNNQWAISVPVSRQTISESIAIKARAYGFSGTQVDGNDLLAVYETTLQAMERARRGEGPTLIEAVTYRMGGHSSSDDPTRYRDTKEVEHWLALDPLERVRRFLAPRGKWSQEREQATAATLRNAIDKELSVVEASPPPTLQTLMEDVFERPPWHLEEEFEDLKARRSSGTETLGKFPL